MPPHQDQHASGAQQEQGEVMATRRTLTGMNHHLIYWMGVAMSLYHLWVNTIGIMPNIQRNALHFSFVCFLGYLMYPVCRRWADKTLKLDYILAILSFSAGLYLIFFEDALHARNEVPILSDLIFAGLAIVLMIEITRRVAGYIIPILAAGFLGYALGLGTYFSGLWKFPGVTLERILYRMYFAPDGIFGKIATISSTYVFLFVLFAAFLLQSGAGNFIIRLSLALMGRMTGGPAKMAVFASGLMGSISGSAVANTVGTGSITIPLMKKVGLKPQFAGGVEAAASTGGQLLPPIMGAGAFIMSQWTQIPYLTIIGVATIPALMYFLSIAFFIHLRAKKHRLEVLSPEEMPAIGQVIKEGWNFLIPLGVLVVLLLQGYTPTYAASAGILAIVVSSWINPHTRMSPRDIMDALAKGAGNMVTTGVILLCSGIVVGIVLMVGAGMKFSMLITSIAGGSLFITIVLVALASLILGMGLPVTASYIVLAVLAAPSMSMLGTSVLAAHMLIFWFSQDANVTPPVCLAAYAASGVAGSKPLATGFESWKLAKGLYIIPLLFVYSPLLFQGPTWAVLETAVLATLGLYCAAAFFEGFHLYDLTWIMRLVMLGAAGLMLWPNLALHGLGFTLFALASGIQLIIKSRHNRYVALAP
ncbi:TRAP transporter permease [Desulfovermiculus halophilus]|jgi:TRAP transporter 4TM/12TM fusion protein|uniref:TRAP transporter permease n=1 Tax=Desulfovermiculus halophilus TaxID=339722 RepID=UPI000685C167|nr:TRAP transporter permease [Desulfovermiculus halophilus]